ncbi:hypothetical protein HHK36_013232 [Tetracentron sinense]|uniref:LysM domain-containing protein n=1 Tax=Tetracentron sinense TaxID=13715 RepID=A0A834ZAR8_TETSI|nr:hypothetical protein HHK36_013232 [Tetracentron sinense]
MKIPVIFLTILLFFVAADAIRGLKNGRCDEVYVVSDGETLQTISEKCDSLFILLDNPHILDTDDVVPGTVLLIKST